MAVFVFLNYLGFGMEIRTDLVAAFVLRIIDERWQVLLLQRPEDCVHAPLTFQIVYGHIEGIETPEAAVIREVLEETSATLKHLYNTGEVFNFYSVHDHSLYLTPLFAAEVDANVQIVLNPENVAYEWLSLADARRTLVWPQQRRALEVIEEIFIPGKVPEVFKIF